MNKPGKLGYVAKKDNIITLDSWNRRGHVMVHNCGQKTGYDYKDGAEPCSKGVTAIRAKEFTCHKIISSDDAYDKISCSNISPPNLTTSSCELDLEMIGLR